MKMELVNVSSGGS